MLEKLKKEDILTVPNLFSAFRIALIPFILWLYCSKGNYYGAFALVALSGLTDVLDGKSALICYHFLPITSTKITKGKSTLCKQRAFYSHLTQTSG